MGSSRGMVQSFARLLPRSANGMVRPPSRRWLDELLNGTVTSIEEIAQRERCSARKVNMILSLAFLAPDLVKAGIDGRLPRGVGVARLCDLPASWSEQFQRLGIAQPRPD